MDNNSTSLEPLDQPNATVQLYPTQPYGVHIVSYIGNGLGVNAIILNIIFLLCMGWIPNNDTAYNRFIKNLSVCDIFGSIFFLVTQNWPQGPFAQILSENNANRLWVHGSPYIFRSIPWMFFTAYMFTLNCLTVSQYLASCRPHVYVQVRRNKIVTIILLGVWSLASLQIVIPTIVLACLTKWPVREAFRRLILISKVEMVVWMVIYTTSTCLSILLNILVYFELRRLKKKQERGRGPETQAIGANTRAKNEAFITVLCLCLASIFCRLPLPLVGMLLITLIERWFGHAVMSWALVTVVLLLYLVFFVDPVIYLLRMPDVRSLLKSTFYRVIRCGATRNKRFHGHSLARLSTGNISVHETGYTTVQSTLL